MDTFFTLDSNRSLVPARLSVSAWSSSQLGGYAVCGALAREIELLAPAEGFVPARLTVDLFRPVRAENLTTRSTVVRLGSRVALIDASVVQEGEDRARASGLYVAIGEDPPGELWRSVDDLPDPPERDDSGPSAPLLRSGDGPWTGDFTLHQNAERKSLWQSFPQLVQGESMSPFQRAAVIGENTSLVCHWGTAGAGFINTDMTLALSRLPEGNGIGLRADSQISCAGVSVGTASLFDRRGQVGSCTVTAISNARRQVDLRTVNTDFDVSGH